MTHSSKHFQKQIIDFIDKKEELKDNAKLNWPSSIQLTRDISVKLSRRCGEKVETYVFVKIKIRKTVIFDRLISRLGFSHFPENNHHYYNNCAFQSNHLAGVRRFITVNVLIREYVLCCCCFIGGLSTKTDRIYDFKLNNARIRYNASKYYLL